MTTTKLSDLSEALIEGYWILNDPADAVASAIGDFLDRPHFYLVGDEPVTPLEFITAIGEIIDYFQGRGIWPINEVSA
jgi:hypothetical protein